LDALIGKSGVVVGGGGALGRCIALALAREGADIVVASPTQSKIDKVAGEVRSLGRKAMAVKTDATDFEQVKRMTEEALNKFGSVDILVNCQGINVMKPFTQTTLKEWDQILDVNLKSVFQTCLAVLPIMVKQKSGHIVNIASRVALGGAERVAPYTASKAGVVGLSQALALEFKRENIKVNVICPSPIDTPLRWKDTPDFDRRLVMKPEVVAQLVALVASWPDSVLQEPVIPASVNMWYGPHQ